MRIEALMEGGSAASSGLDIAPGDVLLRVGDTDVAALVISVLLEPASCLEPQWLNRSPLCWTGI